MAGQNESDPVNDRVQNDAKDLSPEEGAEQLRKEGMQSSGGGGGGGGRGGGAGGGGQGGGGGGQGRGNFGNPEQHAEAGSQSHKNTNAKQ